MSATLSTATDPPAAPATAPADVVASAEGPRPLTEHIQLKRVIMLVNPLSGSVGSGAPAEAEALLSQYACEASVEVLDAGRFDAQIDAALEARPDVLFVLAGDGTAGTIASKAGPDGPLIAPLPGGTMNMLPKALYGTTDWKAALKSALEEGAPQSVAGGEVDDGQTRQAFYCAAIFGSPALWAPAREAIRVGKLGLAWAYARRAFRRAFSGRIRYILDGRPERRSEALVLISPMISRVMEENTGLEAAAMNPADAAAAFRLAATAVVGDWRQDPSVTTKATQKVAMRARSRIPAVIDGEPTLLRPHARVRFIRKAFQALAPIPPAAEDSV
ncbi:diacylglycerol/lipid kinase family protein [Brevundimonas sp. Root1279]|uniref:diacylglycerol/lipid kinase family protein n=1 Tax=Brevundimonas sp. Root1279 TaxID=1736443 RepID=UPI0006F634C5|nr:diacylglycerol kinase family protein [Brevundimonas sp. Root1279]KQW81990.1 diacylglycerol kinase [Brevundimonas sp. Root1279]